LLDSLLQETKLTKLYFKLLEKEFVVNSTFKLRNDC